MRTWTRRGGSWSGKGGGEQGAGDGRTGPSPVVYRQSDLDIGPRPAYKVRMGWRDEFTELYRRWWPRVREEAYRLIRSEDEAEDVAQQVFARLWESGDWRGIENPERFFIRSAGNGALTRLRRRRRRRTLPLTDTMVAVLRQPGDSPEKALIRSERRDVCLQVIGMLPPRCRLVCDLVFLEGMTHREVADELGISLGAVEKQVARGRRRIRDLEDGGYGLSTFGDGGGVRWFVRL